MMTQIFSREKNWENEGKEGFFFLKGRLRNKKTNKQRRYRGEEFNEVEAA